MHHVTPDCVVAQSIWTSIDASLAQKDFFQLNLPELLASDLFDQTQIMYGVPWPLLFASSCNLLWKH